MRNLSKQSIFLLVSALVASFVVDSPVKAEEPVHPNDAHAHDQTQAPLLEGLGSWSFPISTNVPLAQRYFNQGLMLAYGFNHAEAERSFLEAARLDPSCAICFWGAALVLGPNLNAKMRNANVPRAFSHLQHALALSAQANARERALIQALAIRYSPEPVADRSALDRAYANAMRGVVRQFPNDVDILALAAEAQMDLSPWNYWADDGSPLSNTPEILATLERAMELEPMHPGSLHYYIHAVEASPNPERGLVAADRLATLVPGAGHLVHMPAHIYMRTGRYHDAAVANERAIVADDQYLPYADPSNPYLESYRLHNPHFLWAAATLEGRSEVALRAARMVAEMAEGSDHSGHGGGTDMSIEHFRVTPLLALIRFGRWQEILGEPEPPMSRTYSRAIWHHARAIAYSRLGDQSAAYVELCALEKLAEDPSFANTSLSGDNNMDAVLAVALQVTRGELAADRGDPESAIAHLQKAVVLEDKLRYMEPADWHHPTRQVLGAVLVRAGKFTEAERVYREDLVKLPENGYSLFGLALALEGQGRDSEAAEVRRRFDVAFAHADVTLRASRF